MPSPKSLAELTQTKTVWGITVRSAFYVGNRWEWHAFNFDGGNKHAAIIQKARELGAKAWDFGNADVSEVRRVQVAA